MSRIAVALAVIGAAGALALPCLAQPRAEWNFVVRLDGERIGTHRFVVSPDGMGGTTVRSEAHFSVRLLGWTAYRYDHRSLERWQGGCLAGLKASTDDDGRVVDVEGTGGERGFAVNVRDGDGAATASRTVTGCTLTFAYWNAALRNQRRLLDPGTGRLVDVQVTPLPPVAVDTDRGTLNAAGWRIAGLPHAIDIRWDGDDWVALDTTVEGGRRLTYRLR